MGGYIANFMVYVMAMTGLICFAVFIYKKVMDGSFCRNNSNNFLGIEETINLNPRKTLHVVRAGSEKFLIASDVDRTTLISKLNAGGKIPAAAQVELLDDIFSLTEKVQPAETSDRAKIHLDPVKSNTTLIRKGMDRRETYRRVQQKYADTSANRRLSTMKEMAKKINEL